MPIFYTDDQLIELISQSTDPSNTWSTIWETITREGTPLVDEGSLRMTFLFDAAAVSDMDVESVHVWINRLTDKERVSANGRGAAKSAGRVLFSDKCRRAPPTRT